jgi:hypothetical protein
VALARVGLLRQKRRRRSSSISLEITPDTEQRKLSQIDKTVVIEIYVKNYWSLILMSVVHITHINLCKETVICLPAAWIKNYTRTMHVSSLNTKKY